MNYKELVREAIKLLDEYEPDKQFVDTFMEDSAKTLAVYMDINLVTFCSLCYLSYLLLQHPVRTLL